MRKQELCIAIVDDNPIWIKTVIKKLELIKGLGIFEHIDFIFTPFESGVTFLDFNREHEQDLLLLDFDMPQMSGIQVAKELERLKVKTKIIFLSGYENLLPIALETNSIKSVVDFLLKSMSEEQFQYAVVNAIQGILDVHFFELNHYESIYNIDTGKNEKIWFETMIDVKKVEMIIADGKEMMIYVEGGRTFLSDLSLKKWLEILPFGDFAQASKSFIVNFKYVSSIEGKEIYLTNGEDVPLGAGFKSKFKKMRLAYRTREAMK